MYHEGIIYIYLLFIILYLPTIPIDVTPNLT